jgi:hypothetical protein
VINEKDPFNAFDWNWSDGFKDHGARAQALIARPIETSILMNLKKADSLIHFALWSELPRNHPVGSLWLETNTDLLATIYLAYGGFFRQALTILRSWFELAIHGVYFSAHYVQPNARYKQWRQGKRNAPANIEKIARSLANRPNKLITVDEVKIIEKLSIYSFLSEHTHGQGLDIYDLQQGRDNVPRFLPRSFDIWYQKILEAFDSLCFFYRLFFRKEIALYLNKSEGELQRAQGLQKVFIPLMPEFTILMDDIFTFINQHM